MTSVMVPEKPNTAVDAETSGVPETAPPPEDRAIVQLRIARAVDDFQRGVDQEASFALVYTTYVHALERFFRAHGLDAEACRDLTHETLVDVHRGLADYQSHMRFEAWLYGMARSHLPLDEMPAEEPLASTDESVPPDVHPTEDLLSVETLFAYLCGELPPREAMDVQDALTDSPAAQAQLFELQALIDAAPPRNADVAASVAKDVALFQANLRAAAAARSAQPPREHRRLSWSRPRMVMAAVAVAAIIAMVAWWLGRGRLVSSPDWLQATVPVVSASNGAASDGGAPQASTMPEVELLAGVPSVPVQALVGSWLSVTLVTRQRAAPCTVGVSRGVGALGNAAAADRGVLGNVEPSAGKVTLALRADVDGRYGFQLSCGDGLEERYALGLATTAP